VRIGNSRAGAAACSAVTACRAERRVLAERDGYAATGTTTRCQIQVAISATWQIVIRGCRSSLFLLCSAFNSQADVAAMTADKTPNQDQQADSDEKPAGRRAIQGNLPYTPSIGVLKRVLEKIPASEKPSTFNYDFMSTVLGASGGASRPVIPILKKAGLLGSDGTPTELYSQFQTEGGRASASAQALKNGFAEIFRRNQYAHKADQEKVRDLIVAVTGLPKGDAIVKYILNTFEAFQEFAKGAAEETSPSNTTDAHDDTPHTKQSSSSHALGLAYNFNIILPETTNIEVFNAIFKSLKENLIT